MKCYVIFNDLSCTSEVSFFLHFYVIYVLIFSRFGVICFTFLCRKSLKIPRGKSREVYVYHWSEFVLHFNLLCLNLLYMLCCLVWTCCICYVVLSEPVVYVMLSCLNLLYMLCCLVLSHWSLVNTNLNLFYIWLILSCLPGYFCLSTDLNCAPFLVTLNPFSYVKVYISYREWIRVCARVHSKTKKWFQVCLCGQYLYTNVVLAMTMPI